MHKPRLKTLVLIGLLTASSSIMAEPPKTELECRACHGPAGVSQIKIVPSLNCQKEQYLINSMMAYREGRRIDASMSAAMGSMLDADIKELAAYYSKVGCP